MRANLRKPRPLPEQGIPQDTERDYPMPVLPGCIARPFLGWPGLDSRDYQYYIRRGEGLLTAVEPLLSPNSREFSGQGPDSSTWPPCALYYLVLLQLACFNSPFDTNLSTHLVAHSTVRLLKPPSSPSLAVKDCRSTYTDDHWLIP